MPLIDQDEAYASYRKLGANSSHFVWFLADLKFFRTRESYIFGFIQIGDVTLFALEPLIPENTPSFGDAWREFTEEMKPKVSAFVSVYKPFLAELTACGFQNIRIGSEPWVKLTEWMPTGNSGRGVRSARNFAVKAGLSVEEWKSEELDKNAEKRATLKEIYRDWMSPRWLKMSGFTLSTDPFQHMDDRRYFVLRSAKRVEGYGIATPVPKTKSYYLEDMILRRHTVKGAGELLTLEVMSALNTSGSFEASLGVVPAMIGKTEKYPGLPPLFRFLLITVPAQLRSFYNFEGMELYRKRFKPHRWAEVYFAVKNHTAPTQSDTAAWLRASAALFLSFRPRLNLSFRLFYDAIMNPVRKYPVTFFNLFVGAGIFIGVNRGGVLPESVLMRFGFAAVLPFRQWFYRSVVSDFLYTDAFHFYSSFTLLLVVLFWAEKTQPRRFLIPLLILASIFDDFLNYVIVILPFEYRHLGMFQKLVTEKQVGGSLVLAFLLGLQMVRIRKYRELVFVGAGLFSILGIISISGDIHSVLLNLNHFFFLSFGFIVGKIQFEMARRKTRKHAKDKSPVLRSESKDEHEHEYEKEEHE